MFFVTHNWFNVTNSIIIYPAFDIHDNNQGREGLRGNFHLLSIWGGSLGEGNNFFWNEMGPSWHGFGKVYGIKIEEKPNKKSTTKRNRFFF